ncbi:Tn3 family transposase [Glycomyces rhizosphaerae]|uniref:Tn3 family transposase n=1 Tax=Glycomyces rhizosphaerae TaxID=2054422 RepID=A0ABV7Q5I2_9ACTN
MSTIYAFTEAELEQLRRFPSINRAELIKHFTLTAADGQFLSRFRGQTSKLGAAVQLCTLPWLGFVPDDITTAPREAVARLSEYLVIGISKLGEYGDRAQTRTEHLRQIATYLNWRTLDEKGWKDLDEFLFARAMEHDSPKLLFKLACEYLASVKTIRPGVTSLLRRVATAREAAEAETWTRISNLVTTQRAAELDSLLEVEPELKSTRLFWLSNPPTQASVQGVKTELDKLAFLRGLDAHELDLSALPAERRRFLALRGRKLTGQQLQRREAERRYPILLTVLSQFAVDVLDEVVSLFDQAISGRESYARNKMNEALAERAKAGEGRQALLDELLAVLLDTDIADDEVGVFIRGEIGMERLREAHAARQGRLPRDHGHLSMMDASLSYVRQFAPKVLAAVGFAVGVEAVEPLVKAAAILAELYATGARKVPADAPADFVPTKWRGYLDAAAKAGDQTAYRRYWELCVLLALRDALRSGDVFVPGSRRYADPASFLLTAEAWEPLRTGFCLTTGKSPRPAEAIASAEDELHTALTDLERLLGAGGDPGQVRLDDNGELVIPRLEAEFVPEEVNDLRSMIEELLPRVSLAALLVEIDAKTNFLDALTHAGGKVARSPELKRNLFYVLLAEATNMGLETMADSCGVSYDTLAWTYDWYFREATLAEANTQVVNFHHRLPMAQAFGDGTLSSSDGQRFPVRGKSLSARHSARYFGRGAGFSTYTHVSDQHSTFSTKIIVAPGAEAHYVLDDLVGNMTDLPIAEHATDTHGATLANFALFDLVGLQLSPRMRDLGKITLARTGSKAAFETQYPLAGPLLTKKLDTDLIASSWDELLRVSASVKYGHASAALVVGKLCSTRRHQNTTTAAIKEWGLLRRTIYAAPYLADDTYQRRIARQLNRGENVHALRRNVFYAFDGTVRRSHLEQQTEQAWCLTLVTNAIVTWTTEYFGLAVARLRHRGAWVDDELLAHIWPTRHANINFFGAITIDVDAEIAELGANNGHRPLNGDLGSPAAAAQ